MGKAEKTGIGRSLVKHHNQTIQDSKEKGRFYCKQHKNVLESVTDVTDIEAVIEQSDESSRLFSVNHPPANSTSEMAPKELREERIKEETVHASSLRIPRRPTWNALMSVEELDSNERGAFLAWRRSLASIEENEKLVLTPFEKNLDIWRQLWRVVERSHLVVMVVDARDPLFYHFQDLDAYAKEVNEHKRTLLLINKADLLPLPLREKWARYFHLHGIPFIFWSAKAATEASYMQDDDQESAEDADTKIHGRKELLARLQYEAEKVVSGCNGDSESKGVIVGFVGYPNVGKSSTINALVGEKRAGVTSTPGKTKHFQTLKISDQLTLCDCPGLVFPSFTSSRYEMIASGVLHIDKMTNHREAVQVVANKVPRQVLENVFNISLPKPKSYEPRSRVPLASELLRAFCVSRGYVASSGLPDETKAARLILKDFINGKLPHFELPPNEEEESEGGSHSPPLSSESDTSDTEAEADVENRSTPSLHHVLDDLSSFDMANGLASVVEQKGRKKTSNVASSYKLHKKPHRTKDRSWRVKGDGSDGMPLVKGISEVIMCSTLKP